MSNYADKIALELGYTKATLLGKDDKYKYYSLVVNDNNEVPTPIGLPEIIAVDNKGKYIKYADIEALRILSRFNES